MNKKILTTSILAVLMLVTITYASAINTSTASNEKKESPLFKIRTRLAIGEKIGKIMENIKTKFIGNRIFFVPLLMKNIKNDHGVLWSIPAGTAGCCTFQYSQKKECCG
jgi:hypothetical protein